MLSSPEALRALRRPVLARPSYVLLSVLCPVLAPYNHSLGPVWGLRTVPDFEQSHFRRTPYLGVFTIQCTLALFTRDALQQLQLPPSVTAAVVLHQYESSWETEVTRRLPSSCSARPKSLPCKQAAYLSKSQLVAAKSLKMPQYRPGAVISATISRETSTTPGRGPA